MTEPTELGHHHASGPVALDVLSDIEVRLSVEVGSTLVSIADLVRTEPGDVIELGRHVDDLLDIMANGTLIARGEVINIGDHHAVRVVEIVKPAARQMSMERRR